jgi:hypothetical protein
MSWRDTMEKEEETCARIMIVEERENFMGMIMTHDNHMTHLRDILIIHLHFNPMAHIHSHILI